MRSFMVCTPHKIYSGDETKKNEIGGPCSTYGEETRIGGLLGKPQRRL